MLILLVVSIACLVREILNLSALSGVKSKIRDSIMPATLDTMLFCYVFIRVIIAVGTHGLMREGFDNEE